MFSRTAGVPYKASGGHNEAESDQVLVALCLIYLVSKASAFTAHALPSGFPSHYDAANINNQVSDHRAP